MKKLLLAVLFLPVLASAQNFHFATRLGFMGYHGDVKPASKILSQLNFTGSLGARYDLTERLAGRGFFTLGKLRGDDAKSKEAARRARNLNFTSSFWELELGAQYSLLSLNERWWTPYVFGGISMYHVNPYTTFNDQKVFLYPLSTEGQGFVPGVPLHKRTRFSIPLGVGAHYALGEDTRVGVEAGYRILFTDYLDDVSGSYVDEATLRTARGQQAVDVAFRTDELNAAATYPTAKTVRGDGKKNVDGIYYISLTFSLRYWFDKYKQTAGLPGGGREKKVGCPGSRVR